MSKYIEKVERYKCKVLETALGKLKEEYSCADGSYGDTGYDRYFKKMSRCEKEINEIEEYLLQGKQKEVQPQVILECEEMRRTLQNIKSKWFYLKADLPVSEGTIGIDDLLRDVR